jgi:energy-converting hydrogenase Eha subunit E
MATITRPGGLSAERAQMMRETWERFSKRGASALGPVLDFLVAHPTLSQGLYYVLTGLWPLVSLATFQAATGPKTDTWLVQTVGVLVTVIGATLCLAAYRRNTAAEIVLLAIGSALGLAAVDVTFVLERRISAVYLLDALVEVGIIALWVYGWLAGYHPGAARPPAYPQAIPVMPPAAGVSAAQARPNP